MKILVHLCCGPCGIMVLQRLADAGHSLTGFFFNPNIHPLAEYLRRREGALQVAQKMRIPLIMEDALSPENQRWYEQDTLKRMGIAPDPVWRGIGEGVDKDQNLTKSLQSLAVPEAVNPVPWLRLMVGQEHARCGMCWRIRLFVTAWEAEQEGFDAFTSSLLYSRYQNHESLCAEGKAAAASAGVCFMYEDFRTSWQQGIALSKEWGVYRQPYCGCIFSEYDRYARQWARDTVL